MGASTPPAPDPSRPASPHEQLGAAFKATMAAVRRLRGRETHTPGRLSNAQYGLLFSLAGGGKLSARELAQAADLAPATVAQMLEALEEAGLVERLRSEEDRRIVLTALTARGRIMVAEHRARVEPRWRAALAEFSDEQLLSATLVLERLARFFDEWEHP
jgi:DNA-binding MarR family transcriptional regulator